MVKKSTSKKSAPKQTKMRGAGRLTKAPADLAARLVSGESQTAIARELGVRQDTIKRWVGHPTVIAEIAELRRAALTAARRRLEAGSEEAVDVVLRTMTEDTGSRCEVCGRSGATPRDRLTAAEMVLSRVGLPKSSAVVIEAAAAVQLSPSDDGTILRCAADILHERGLTELADRLREVEGG